MINVPGTRKYAMFSGSYGRSAGYINLDTQQAFSWRPLYNHFCDGVAITGEGRPILVGGHLPVVQGMRSGMDVISAFDNNTNTYVFVSKMSFRRWYATPLRLADNKLLIVGGTINVNVGPSAPLAELWDPYNPTAPTVNITQPRTFTIGVTTFGNQNWYPFMMLLPRGEIIWWGDRGGSITDANFRLIRDLPPLPRSYGFRTIYKYTAAFAPMAFKPEADGNYTRFGFMFFGGGPAPARATTVASPFSGRLDLWYCATGICDSGWVIESMLNQPRTMPDATVIPNGKILVHGGAQTGYAGLGNPDGMSALRPASVSMMYDPDAPARSRFTFTGNIIVARMYHSAVCVDVTGFLLSGGCETCNVPMPPDLSGPNPRDNGFEYRLTWGTPYEIAPPVVRPFIVSAPPVIVRGDVFTVSYSYSGTITGAVLLAPCAATHSINMNQRVVFMTLLQASDGVGIIQGLPANLPSLAPFGWYILFLLGDKVENSGNTYSQGVWLQLRDAPSSVASRGRWWLNKPYSRWGH